MHFQKRPSTQKCVLLGLHVSLYNLHTQTRGQRLGALESNSGDQAGSASLCQSLFYIMPSSCHGLYYQTSDRCCKGCYLPSLGLTAGEGARLELGVGACPGVGTLVEPGVGAPAGVGMMVKAGVGAIGVGGVGPAAGASGVGVVGPAAGEGVLGADGGVAGTVGKGPGGFEEGTTGEAEGVTVGLPLGGFAAGAAPPPLGRVGAGVFG